MRNTKPTSLSTPNPNLLNFRQEYSNAFRLPARLYPRLSPMNEWTWSENKQFEGVEADFNVPEGTIQEMAAKISEMALDQIDQQCKVLLDDIVKVSKMEPYKETRGRKGRPWTERELRLFLLGLSVYGKGDWRNISCNFVPTKTPIQVARHAQQYLIHNKQEPRGKNHRNYKQNVLTPYPRTPTIRTAGMNSFPLKFSRTHSEYGSPIVQMSRNFAQMPPFPIKDYGNSSNNLLNLNTFNPVLNNSSYASNYMPSGFNIKPQGFASTGSNYVPHSTNSVPNGVVSDTLIGVSNTPNFGINEGSDKVSNGQNYDLNYLANIMFKIPPTVSNTLNDINHPIIISDSPSYESNDPDYKSNGWNKVSNPTVAYTSTAPRNNGTGNVFDAPNFNFPTYSLFDLLEPLSDSIGIDQWGTNMSFEDLSQLGGMKF